MKTTNNRWHSNQVWHHLNRTILSIALLVATFSFAKAEGGGKDKSYPTLHKTVEVNGLEIFYREAGNPNKPTILLLHGYPTSSHMFRNLISDLSDDYHLLAPDYPGYGQSEQPPMAEFDYTFDNLANIVEGFLDALEVNQYSIYLMDYGAPVGYRLFANLHPNHGCFV